MANIPNRFVVVIPVFNQLHYTSQCVESLLRQCVETDEILIIDNASSDETPLWLAQHSELKHLRNKVNLGCGCAWAQGVVLSPDAEWIVLLNNDVLSGPAAINNLLDAAERSKLGVVSPALLEGPNDYDFENFARQYQKSMSGMIRRNRFHGVCFALHRSVIEKIGFPDTDRRLGGYEDAEFLVRCRRAGIPVGIVGDSVFHHFGSITQKAIKQKTGQKSLGDLKYFRSRVGSKWWSRKRDKFLSKFIFRKWINDERAGTGYSLHMIRRDGVWELR
ncbi:glycosyltransferase family 2 protein [Chlorobium sp. BLA1]|uniref:glycosyltransferase family 2 protein n=1 Tax=Candidatus Chlorobium masyuteum TaxID=2716876 RepID=UPI001423C6AE|nr:glycosyltransferase family 2 protein [Candidatus Chlorobium masyuteum]NHQ59887.1 glycosyltransferase family 2 protein [Candidatus Chlorobium masyuteum]